MSWASREKIFPFYFQRKSCYIYAIFSLILGFWLFFDSSEYLYHDVFVNEFSLKNVSSPFDTFIYTDVQGFSLMPEYMYLFDNFSLFVHTPLVVYSRLFIILASIIAIFLTQSYLDSIRYNHFEYYLFIYFSTLAMLILISSNNALLTYLAIELQSLCLYLLASSQRKSIHSIEAGLKYMFIGSLASGAMLIGFSYLYFLTGSLVFSEISTILSAQKSFYDFSSLVDINYPISKNKMDEFFYLTQSPNETQIRWDVVGPNAPYSNIPSIQLDPNLEGYNSSLDYFHTLVKNGIKDVDLLDQYFRTLEMVDLITLASTDVQSFFIYSTTPLSLYVFSGLTNTPLIFFYVAGIFILFSLLLKLAAAPYHMWLSDVYEGSPTSTTIYFLLVPKISLLVVFYRFVDEIFFTHYGSNRNITFLEPTTFKFLTESLFFTFIIISVLYSFIIGYSGVLKAGIGMKRLFAFSSIAHLGFILLPFASKDIISIYDTPSITINSVSMYMLLYFLSTIASARAILLFTSPKIDYINGRRVHYSIENLPTSFHVISPSNALFIFLLFITFVGIPPTAGFFMKLYPLMSVINSLDFFLILIWPMIVFSSYVYVRVIIALFFKDFEVLSPRYWSTLTVSDGYVTTWLSVCSVIFLSTYAYQTGVLEVLSLGAAG